MNTDYSKRHVGAAHWSWKAAGLFGAFVLQAGAAQALAGERTVATAFGDAVVIDAPAQRKGVQAQAFATQQQRAAVKPMAWTDKANPQLDYLRPEDEQMGPSGTDGGGRAAPGANQRARLQFAQAWDSIQAQDKAADKTALDPVPFDGTHGIFTRYPGNLRTQMWKYAPWNKIGKLYFNTPGGGSSYCTANVASGNDIIVTAAHCVYSRGQGWNSNFVFVPADRYGVAPYDTYGWSAATVPGNWISVGGRRWDVGLIRLSNGNASGLPVTDWVGWLGRSWNQPYVLHLHSVGYASNFSTQYTNICAAQSFFSGDEGTNVLVKGCDMTYGSSGGGWLLHYSPYTHSGNYVNGVVSGPHIGAFGTTYVGPRFASDNLLPLCSALGC